MAVAAAVIGVVGSLFEGIAGYSSAQYQAKVADMNAEIAQENAARAIERSQIEQQSQDAQSQAALGEIEAEQGASGIGLSSRSFSAVRQNARTLGRLDALNVRQAGELEAYGYRTDAANFRAQAAASRSEGGWSLLGGFVNAGSSLISGAARSPKKFDQFGQSKTKAKSIVY